MDARFRRTRKWKKSRTASDFGRFDLHFRPIGVIHVVIATPIQKEKIEMTTVIPEENGNSPAMASGKKAKANKKARVAPRRANVVPAQAKSARKTTPAKKAPKGGANPEVAKAKGARDGSKTAEILNLLKRHGGATLKELIKATGWLPHSVRGFLSGKVGQKMGLTVTSTKGEDGERTYSVKT
jgi:hypothetical protein